MEIIMKKYEYVNVYQLAKGVVFFPPFRIIKELLADMRVMDIDMQGLFLRRQEQMDVCERLT